MKEQLKQVFDMIDADKSGELTVDELIKVLEQMGEKVNKEAVVAELKKVDTDGNGKLNFKEFCKIVGV